MFRAVLLLRHVPWLRDVLLENTGNNTCDDEVLRTLLLIEPLFSSCGSIPPPVRTVYFTVRNIAAHARVCHVVSHISVFFSFISFSFKLIG